VPRGASRRHTTTPITRAPTANQPNRYPVTATGTRSVTGCRAAAPRLAATSRPGEGQHRPTDPGRRDHVRTPGSAAAGSRQQRTRGQHSAEEDQQQTRHPGIPARLAGTEPGGHLVEGLLAVDHRDVLGTGDLDRTAGSPLLRVAVGPTGLRLRMARLQRLQRSVGEAGRLGRAPEQEQVARPRRIIGQVLGAGQADRDRGLAAVVHRPGGHCSRAHRVPDHGHGKAGQLGGLAHRITDGGLQHPVGQRGGVAAVAGEVRHHDDVTGPRQRAAHRVHHRRAAGEPVNEHDDTARPGLLRREHPDGR
jgi:hypothetical protein